MPVEAKVLGNSPNPAMVRITCGPGLHTCVWNESLTTSQKQAWQLLPPPGDCRGGAFATFVANERYVDPAICLRRQLRRVGSECPAIALFDDREDAASGLSGASRERLAHAYGAQSLIPLTQLLRRAGAEPTNLSQYGRGGGDPMFGVRQPLVRPPRRQLFETRQGSSEWNALFLKLFFWAIDPAKYPRVVLLDADLLLRHSLDPLLAHEFTSAVAGVPCTDDINYFNTGVMVLRPSLPTLRFLLRTRPGKKCENKITDQSVINLYFQHRGWCASLVARTAKNQGRWTRAHRMVVAAALRWQGPAALPVQRAAPPARWRARVVLVARRGGGHPFHRRTEALGAA